MDQPVEKMYIAGILTTGNFKVIAYLGDLTIADKSKTLACVVGTADQGIWREGVWGL